MNAAEIILLILGFVSISVSFFIGNRREDNEGRGGMEEAVSKDIWTEKEEEMVREQVEAILNDEREQMLAETTDSLNRKSNEKIMEFDEFSSQILEKINRNHEEVVFMYNMLNEKQRELREAAAKTTVKKQEKAEQEEQAETGVSAPTVGHEPEPRPQPRPASGMSRAATKPKAPKAKPEPAPAKKKASAPKGDTNEAIVQMYKQGKSVLDISKELNIGQGEVKLMIALYGGNK